MIPPLVELTLDYYRNPLDYSHLADGSFPLPRGFAAELSALHSALSPLHIDATARAIDSSVDELLTAARFFARHVLLDPSASYYRALGVSPRASRAVIREHYRFLIGLFHPDRLPQPTEHDVACSRRLNTAHHVLSDPARRALYDREHLRATRQLRCSDPRDFFRAHRVPLQTPDAPRRAERPATGWRWRIALVLGCVVVVAFGIAAWRFEPERPLRVATPLETSRQPPHPHYLRGEETPQRKMVTTAVSGSGAPIAANAISVVDAARVAAQQPPDAAAIGTRIASELQIAFRRGDTDKLAELFAESFVTDLPEVSNLLLAHGHRPKGGDTKLWLTLTDMVWQHDPNGRISGRGQVLVGKGAGRNAGVQGLSGAVELELIRCDSDYCIRSLHIAQD